jgi:hypothetical protein
MPPAPPQTPPLVIGLTVLVGLSVSAIAAGVMVPAMLGSTGAWPVLVGGTIALVVALAGLWVIAKRRDRSLR